MLEHEGDFPVATMARLLGVSKSGYYSWRERGESNRARENRLLGDRIEEIYRGTDEVYGSPRIHQELRASGANCGRHRVARLMREKGLQAVQKRNFVVTTDSAHKLPTAENLLGRNFHADFANEKWAGDITYIPTAEGWLYLAVVIDLFSRRVVGWAMREKPSRELVLKALQMAIEQRGGPAKLFHSDRGSQYASDDVQRLLTKFGISCSMSRTGDCWDNAVVESFFHTLKVERVHRRKYKSRQEARQNIFEYIERFYNRCRRHSTLGYRSPAEFEVIANAA